MTPGGYTLAPGPEWTQAAANWPCELVARETEPGHFLTDIVPAVPRGPLGQWHLCCAVCPGLPSVFCFAPDADKPGYRVAWGDVLAGILAHIRRSHQDVVAS